MADFPGPPVPARPASTVLALRTAAAGFEVLMVRRAAGSEFMGNAVVFPGGALDEADRSPQAADAVAWDGDPAEVPWRAAALRELYEEAGLALTDPVDLAVPADAGDLYRAVVEAGGRLDARRLHWVSRWITPEGLPRRFDTRFYVAEVRGGSGVSADGREVFDDTWVAPAEALARGAAGTWEIPFPTMRHLEMLAAHDSVASVLAAAGALEEIPSVLPRVVLGENGEYTVRVPGDPGYEAEVQP